MPQDKTFQPEFGPNGAVLNAPTMTPEMRAKIEEAARPPSMRRMAREFLPFGIVGLAVVALMVLWPVFDSLWRSSTWWAGFLSGILAVLAAAYLVFMIYRLLVQWELIGRLAVARKLVLPDWARWSLVASGALAAFGQVLLSALLALSIGNAAVTPDVYLMFGVAVLLGMTGLAFTLLLSAFGRKAGWTMHAAA